ncbi:MAG: hypothetical protein JWP44_1571 [Mucilaginibacter sp.]|nr:hypothetical protein [Mucilaginibacter sp.]
MAVIADISANELNIHVINYLTEWQYYKGNSHKANNNLSTGKTYRPAANNKL